jgi:hypothetical protein
MPIDWRILNDVDIPPTTLPDVEKKVEDKTNHSKQVLRKENQVVNFFDKFSIPATRYRVIQYESPVS